MTTRNVPRRATIPPPGGFDPDHFRRVLEEAGFSEKALAGLSDRPGLSGGIDLDFALRRTASGQPRDDLLRLFNLGADVPVASARRVFSPPLLDALLENGLFGASQDRIHSNFALLPFEGHLLAHDFGGAARLDESHLDDVMGVGLSSIVVGRLDPGRPARRALDLGAGSGYLSLMAARHADQVLATDLNPRALRLVEFNAWLNGVTKVETAPGSLFEPVGDRRFDLILSNPPFALSPDNSVQFRDSGMAGDSLSETVLRGAARHLEDQGIAVATCGWHHDNADDWAGRPLRWLEESGCDVWLLCLDTQDPLSYASQWSRIGAVKPEEYGRQMDRWVTYFVEQGIRRLSWGCAILRKRAGPCHWRRSERLDADWDSAAFGRQVDRIIAAEDYLSRADDGVILAASWRLVAEHVLEQSLHAAEGGWRIEAERIRLTEGFAYTGNVDRTVRAILPECDGTRPLSDIADSLAERLGAPGDNVRRAMASLARVLIAQGLLTRE